MITADLKLNGQNNLSKKYNNPSEFLEDFLILPNE